MREVEKCERQRVTAVQTSSWTVTEISGGCGVRGLCDVLFVAFT